MLKFYDTYKKKKVEFKPIEPGKVRMYTCGPTVYDFPTIGNLRGFTFDDLLRRSLEYLGYDVTQVMNITDVGHLTLSDLQKEALKGKDIEITDTEDGLDRMEKAAKREGLSVWDVAQKYIDATFGKDYKNKKEYSEDGAFGKMNFEKPEFIPRATEMIDEQIELIKKLEAKGFTYKTNEAVYFDISKFPRYEELVGQSFDEMRKGERANVSDKDRKHPADFRLWQLDQPNHEMQWDSPWGKGFPGWHIECSAMSGKLLGIPFDIHTGGEDHIKVHHPSEMAQTESATGKQMANYWMHNAFLTVDGKRMGKSLGNAYTLDDIDKYKFFDENRAEVTNQGNRNYNILSLRLFYLEAHYRSKQDFNWDDFERSRLEYGKIVDKVGKYKNYSGGKILKSYKDRFIKALEDDLNTPRALAVFRKLIKSDNNYGDKLVTLLDFDKVFGLGIEKMPLKAEVTVWEKGKIVIGGKSDKNTFPIFQNKERFDYINRQVVNRIKSKKIGDYVNSDRIRDELKKDFNLEINDIEDKGRCGTTWSGMLN